MPKSMIEELEKAIEIKRKKMGELADSLGYTHPQTVQASQELDKLIMKHMKAQRS